MTDVEKQVRLILSDRDRRVLSSLNAQTLHISQAALTFAKVWLRLSDSLPISPTAENQQNGAQSEND